MIKRPSCPTNWRCSWSSPSYQQENSTKTTSRWRQIQYLADVFWKRWCKEYLTQLQERQRWSTPGRNFCVGDLVLVVDDMSTRNWWPLGRIVQTVPDKKGLVRQVKVKTKINKLCCPITKLCLLHEAEDNCLTILKPSPQSVWGEDNDGLTAHGEYPSQRGRRTRRRFRNIASFKSKHFGVIVWDIDLWNNNLNAFSLIDYHFN